MSWSSTLRNLSDRIQISGISLSGSWRGLIFSSLRTQDVAAADGQNGKSADEEKNDSGEDEGVCPVVSADRTARARRCQVFPVLILPTRRRWCSMFCGDEDDGRIREVDGVAVAAARSLGFLVKMAAQTTLLGGDREKKEVAGVKTWLPEKRRRENSTKTSWRRR